MKNKLFIITSVIISIVMCMTAYAENASIAVYGKVDLEETGGGGGDSGNAIMVTVPTALYFTITPNSDTLVTSVPDDIINNSSKDVKVDFIGYIPVESNTCNVVAYDTYTDAEWLELGQTDTESKIGLGLNVGDSTLGWSLADITNTETTSIGSFILNGSQQQPISVAVKCGKAWSSDRILDYTLHLVLSSV